MDIEELELNKKIKTIEIWSDLAQSSAREKYLTLSTICSLAATLLIIATFNEKLFPLTNYVKILVAILLFLIPFSLWGLLYVLHKDEKNARIQLDKEVGEKMKSEGVMNFILNIFPYIITFILTVIIILIIFLIFGIKFCYIA